MTIASKKQAEKKARIARGENIENTPKNIDFLQSPVSVALRKQMEKKGNISPRILGVDMASGPDKTAIFDSSTKQTHVIDHERSPAIKYDYDQMKAVLEAHLGLLKDQTDVSRKVELKTKWVPDYLPYLDQYVNGDDVHPNGVLVWLSIWMWDIEDYTNALKYAVIAISQGNDSPPTFKATLAEHFCDALFKWADPEFKAGRSVEPWLSQLAKPVFDAIANEEHTNPWMVNDVCGSKLLVLYGHHLERSDKLKDALTVFETAQALPNGRGGCKGHISRIKKKLGNEE